MAPLPSHPIEVGNHLAPILSPAIGRVYAWCVAWSKRCLHGGYNDCTISRMCTLESLGLFTGLVWCGYNTVRKSRSVYRFGAGTIPFTVVVHNWHSEPRATPSNAHAN